MGPHAWDPTRAWQVDVVDTPSFDASAQVSFKQTMATYAGVSTDMVELTVEAASIIVTSTIRFGDSDAALSVADSMELLDPEAASSTFSVPVEAISLPSVAAGGTVLVLLFLFFCL